MTPHVELAILGGGCAGLSLVMALESGRQWHSDTVVIERTAQSVGERTWCFWRDPALALDGLVSQQWTTFEVRDGARRVRVECDDQPYQMIRGVDFHAKASAVLQRTPWVALRAGESVGEVRRGADGLWQVCTSSGLLRARHVVDTRPPEQLKDADALLWQSFLGLELEFDEDHWDTEAVSLMDFLPSAGDDLRFLYVLPFSARRALVELTVFGPRRLGGAELEPGLMAAIARCAPGRPWRVVRREHGMLPMGLVMPRAAGTSAPARAGLMHGSARPSTGYAFQRIQRWAHSCATSLGRGAGPTPAPADARWLQAMDHMFLQVLRDHPSRGAELFCTLFADVPPRRLLRFLGTGDRLRDALAVARALPASLFLPYLWGRPRHPEPAP